jgi:hypothetical protein
LLASKKSIVEAQELFRLEDLSLELETFLAVQAYQPFLCLVCGKETTEEETPVVLHKDCSRAYGSLRERWIGSPKKGPEASKPSKSD